MEGVDGGFDKEKEGKREKVDRFVNLLLKTDSTYCWHKALLKNNEERTHTHTHTHMFQTYIYHPSVAPAGVIGGSAIASFIFSSSSLSPSLLLRKQRGWSSPLI